MTTTPLTLDALRRRRAEILTVARQRRATRVRVFGSMARGDAGPRSDVDLLVDFAPKASLLDQVGLVHDLKPSSASLGRGVVRRAAPVRHGHPRHRDRAASSARDLDALLADLAEAVDAAAELVACGSTRWVAERPLRLAEDAVVGRIGDIAGKLPVALVAGTPALAWAEIKGIGACPRAPGRSARRGTAASKPSYLTM